MSRALASVISLLASYGIAATGGYFDTNPFTPMIYFKHPLNDPYQVERLAANLIQESGLFLADTAYSLTSYTNYETNIMCDNHRPFPVLWDFFLDSTGTDRLPERYMYHSVADATSLEYLIEASENLLYCAREVWKTDMLMRHQDISETLSYHGFHVMVQPMPNMQDTVVYYNHTSEANLLDYTYRITDCLAKHYIPLVDVRSFTRYNKSVEAKIHSPAENVPIGFFDGQDAAMKNGPSSSKCDSLEQTHSELDSKNGTQPSRSNTGTARSDNLFGGIKETLITEENFISLVLAALTTIMFNFLFRGCSCRPTKK